MYALGAGSLDEADINASQLRARSSALNRKVTQETLRRTDPLRNTRRAPP